MRGGETWEEESAAFRCCEDLCNSDSSLSISWVTVSSAGDSSLVTWRVRCRVGEEEGRDVAGVEARPGDESRMSFVALDFEAEDGLEGGFRVIPRVEMGARWRGRQGGDAREL